MFEHTTVSRKKNPKKTKHIHFLSIHLRHDLKFILDKTCCIAQKKISWIHLKFVPEGLNPNDRLFLCSPGYTHFVVITVFSVKIGVTYQ